MAKLVRYILIPFFAIFLMSQNVSAFSVNQNIEIKEVVNNPRMSFYNGSSWTDFRTGFIRLNRDSGSFTQIRTSKVVFTSVDEFEVGDYIIMNGFISIDNVVEGFPEYSAFIGSNAQDVSCPIIDFEFGAVQDYINYSNGSTVYWKRADFQFTCKIVSEAYAQTINFRINPDVINTGASTLNVSFNTAILATPSDAAEKEKNAANQNINQNEQDSNSSSSDAGAASQSLVSAIGGFVSSVTSASPSNCQINGNMGNIDLGNIDLCANPVPSYIQIISSLILVCICIPFAIIMFNRFIALFRSFQG